MTMSYVLGIETSCDETGIAIYHKDKGLLAHEVYSQVDLHAQYGGVVPELASRDHSRKLLPLVEQVLTDSDLTLNDLNGIAYTAGPGLIGALYVGAAFGRTLAWRLNVPAIAVHHMEGHLLAPMLEGDKPTGAFVALLVSGGHTMLVEVKRIGEYHILGESIDDAVGEAFDKTAKLLGLPYPGGAALAKLAQEGKKDVFKFTRPMINRPGCDFSFSGLKTQVANTVRAQADLSRQTKADIAHGFEETATDTLQIKCHRALKQTGLKQLVVAGGVSANLVLRKKLKLLAEKEGYRVFFPAHELCTDNGAMIAYAGFLRLEAGQCEPLAIRPRARWTLTELEAI